MSFSFIPEYLSQTALTTPSGKYLAPLYLSDIQHLKSEKKHPPVDTGSIGETTTISNSGEAVREENLPILSETHSEQKTEEKPNEAPSLGILGTTGDYDLGQLELLTDEGQKSEV